MFDYDESPEEEKSTDYTGPIIVALLAPVFFLFVYFDRADMGLGACIVLGMAMIAIRLHWKLRQHLWFWGIVVFILALHIPLLFLVRWPQGNVPTLAYTMPIGIVDFLIMSGAIRLGAKMFPRNVSSTGEEND